MSNTIHPGGSVEIQLTIQEVIGLGGIIFWAGALTVSVWRNRLDIQMIVGKIDAISDYVRNDSTKKG